MIPSWPDVFNEHLKCSPWGSFSQEKESAGLVPDLYLGGVGDTIGKKDDPALLPLPVSIGAAL